MPPAWRTSPEARRVLTEAIFSTLPIDSIPLSSLGATTDDLLAALAERLAGRLNRHPSAFKLRPADTLGGLLEAVSDLLDDSISTIAEKGEPAALEWPALARANVTALVSCLPPPQPDLSTRPSYDRHVLLSGATSAIGCALLEILMADDAIDKVPCLVSESTAERAMASLLQHLNLSGYDVPRFFAAGVELEVLACDVKAPGWGLRPGDEERLAGGVIDVVAAGWQSDAHESLAGYEVACVRRACDCDRLSCTLMQEFSVLTSHMTRNRQRPFLCSTFALMAGARRSTGSRRLESTTARLCRAHTQRPSTGRPPTQPLPDLAPLCGRSG